MLAEEVKSILSDEMSLLAGRIISNIIRNKQNATGALIKSLRIEATETTGSLFAYDYLTNLESGTLPGTYVTSEIINKWGNAKGFWSGYNYRSSTISRRILNSGSLLFRNGGRKDVYTNEIPLTESTILEKVGNIIINTKIIE